MTNLYFERLQRDPRFRKKETQPPAETSDLGAAIAQLIREAAQAGAEAVVEKQTKPNPAIPEHRRPFTNKPEQHDFPPPPPRAKPIKNLEVSLQRDAAGKPVWCQVGDVKFEIQRNGEGRITRMVQIDESPVLPQPPVPYKASAREYKEPEQ